MERINPKDYFLKTEDINDIEKNENEVSLDLIQKAIDEFKSKIDHKILIKDALDNKGNIKNGGEVFFDFLTKKLINKFGENNVLKNEYSIDYIFENLTGEQIQEDLSVVLNNKDNEKDLECIIITKFIFDLERSAHSATEGFGINNQVVIENLIKKFKDKNTTFLEKSFLKDCIYWISTSGWFQGWSEKRQKLFLKSLEKKIGKDRDYQLNNYFNGELNFFEFDFNEVQRKTIIDGCSMDSSDIGQPLYPLNIEHDDKKSVSGNYISSMLAPGIIGIYSIDGRLVGWQNYGELKKDKQNKLKDFFEIKKKCPMNSIEDLALFKVTSSLNFREYIQKVMEIDLSELSLENQFYFLNFIQGKTEEELSRFREFIKKSKDEQGKINKLKTFLSIEQGGEKMGDKILALGDKLPEESCNVLFKTYGEMIDASSDVADLLKNNLGEKATPELIESTQKSLLFSGKDLLERYAGKAETCEGISCEEIGQELKDRLSLAKRSVFAFSHACKVLVERGEFSFEDFQKAKLSYDQSPLPEEMQNKIITMHEENTKQYPEGLKNRWRGTLRDGLANENPDQLVVSASYEDEVVAAMRVIKQKDGSWYGASFNVNPTVQGSRIGTELLKEVLKTLAKDKPFVADCYSKNPMLKTYLEKFGFKITKEIENYEGTGELVYQITIFPEKTK